nr:hypothetical protein [Mucilaginibacter sp. L294]
MILKLFKRALPFLFIAIGSTCYAQKIKTEEITYDYNRPPAVAVDKNIRNYQVSMESGYEAKNKQLLADYNKEKQTAQETYQKEIAVYAGLVKEAQARYDKELADYNKKSFGAKLADKSIGEGGKPVKTCLKNHIWLLYQNRYYKALMIISY